MEYEIIGQVTYEEKCQIIMLIERKAALEELKLCEENIHLVDIDKETLLQHIQDKIEETNTVIKHWWRGVAIKYNWEKSAQGEWIIEPETAKVILLK